MIEPRDENERLQLEEADAWYEYLHAVRDAKLKDGTSYADVEPWAWQQLQAKRRKIAGRRRQLEKAAA